MRPSSADKCQRGREPVIREDGSIEIPLTKGKSALVDLGSYCLVREKMWYFCDGYARSSGKHRLMHRAILDAPPWREVDHINHDTLDNRNANLRLVTSSQNHRNERKRPVGGSKFKGVYFSPEKRRWRATIQVNGKFKHVGYFRNEVAAAGAYDAAARQHFGECAFTNEDAGLLPAMKETGT